MPSKFTLIGIVDLNQIPIPDSLILDGQQRLTSAYMCLRSGAAVSIRVQASPLANRQTYIQERWYYIDIPAALNREIDYLWARLRQRVGA